MIYLYSLAFILGIPAGRLLTFPIPNEILLTTGMAILAITFFFRRPPRLLSFSTCVLLFLLGLWRYQSVLPSQESAWIQSLNDGPEMKITGRIVNDPEITGTHQKLTVGHLRLEDGQSFSGQVLVKSRRYPAYHYGDTITFRGGPTAPPEFNDFSYRDYLAAKGIYSLMEYPEINLVSTNGGSRFYAALLAFRQLLEAKISRLLPEPESSLLAGILLGVKRSLPPDFYNALQKSGTLHVVVVSGQNITFVMASLIALSGIFFTRRSPKVLIAAAGILTYALMIGGDAAVWRATLMGLAVLLAVVLGRRRLAQQALFLSAAMLLLFNPLSLWQISFQLSFAATSGIIFLQDILGSRLQVLGKFMRDGLVTTLAAQLAVLPVLVHNFQSLSLVSPLANLLIFWLVPLITTIGVITLLVTLAFWPLGQLLAAVAFVPLKIFTTIVEFSSNIPFAQIEIPKAPLFVWAVYYLVLVVFVVASGDA